jgi:hypothetical protein
MRTYRIFVTAAAAMLAVGMIGAGAGAKPPKSGTFTYTDITPNPSNFGECMNTTVPSAPSDVNSYPVKVTKKSATLTLTSHNAADWAAQVTDSKGNIIASADGPTPTDVENLVVTLRKGSYNVNYCNWAGEPQITVDWALK